MDDCSWEASSAERKASELQLKRGLKGFPLSTSRKAGSRLSSSADEPGIPSAWSLLSPVGWALGEDEAL